MKTVWVVGTRNDYYSENEIYIFEKEYDAKKFFEKIIEENKDENEFAYEEGDGNATWEYKGYYCSASVWQQELR